MLKLFLQSHGPIRVILIQEGTGESKDGMCKQALQISGIRMEFSLTSCPKISLEKTDRSAELLGRTGV